VSGIIYSENKKMLYQIKGLVGGVAMGKRNKVRRKKKKCLPEDK